MLCDSHCHLQDRKFAADMGDVIARAREAGVTSMVTIGYDMPSSRRAVEIASQHPDIRATVGVHPHDAKTVTAADLNELEALAAAPGVVGIGEIGLDYYRDLSPHEDQDRAFRDQLALASSLGLPVVIHARDADEAVFSVLEGYAGSIVSSWRSDRPLGVMHCYAGDLVLARRYADLGFVISIAGTVTYPAAEKTREVAKEIPLSALTLETDSPYLPPQSIRGQRNEPARVKDVAEFVAGLRGVDTAIVAEETARTAARLFGR
jgi:TatD DNase family protein